MVPVMVVVFDELTDRLLELPRVVDMYGLLGQFYPVLKGLNGNCTDESG